MLIIKCVFVFLLLIPIAFLMRFLLQRLSREDPPARHAAEEGTRSKKNSKGKKDKKKNRKKTKKDKQKADQNAIAASEEIQPDEGSPDETYAAEEDTAGRHEERKYNSPRRTERIAFSDLGIIVDDYEPPSESVPDVPPTAADRLSKRRETSSSNKKRGKRRSSSSEEAVRTSGERSERRKPPRSQKEASKRQKRKNRERARKRELKRREKAGKEDE